MSHSKTRGLLSIATSAGFLVPVALLIPHHAIAALAYVALAIGTLFFHATDQDLGLDAAGMVAAICVLIALPFGWVAELVALLGGLALGKLYYNHTLVASLIIPVGVVCLIQGRWLPLVLALALFAISFSIWRRLGDWPHAVWHVGTAAAMTTIVLALA